MVQADDPSSIYFNHAGSTQLRRVHFSFGTVLIGGSTTYTSTRALTAPPGTTTRGDFGSSVAWLPPSNFYLTGKLRDLDVSAFGDMTVGPAVLSPLGTMYRYPDSGPFATPITRNWLELIDIKPTVAYKINDQLSDIYTFSSLWGIGQAETKFLSSGGPGLPPAGTPLEINGKDTAASGINLRVNF
jgi:long-chain fatty acid transport protein